MGAPAARRAATALVAVLALAGCSGVRPTLGDRVPAGVAGSPGSGAGGTPAAPVRVALVGDSLTVGEYATLPGAAEARGVRLDISAEAGRRVPTGAEELRRLAVDHDVFVVALGTNDAEPGLTPERAAALIDAALWSVAPGATVLWLTVHRAPGTEAEAAAAVFNESLRVAVARHPQLVVLDWAGVVASRPELLAPDGIHLTPDGYAVRSAWLVDRVVEHLPVA